MLPIPATRASSARRAPGRRRIAGATKASCHRRSWEVPPTSTRQRRRHAAVCWLARRNGELPQQARPATDLMRVVHALSSLCLLPVSQSLGSHGDPHVGESEPVNALPSARLARCLPSSPRSGIRETRDYAGVEQLLADSLRSVLRQEHPAFSVWVVGNRRPAQLPDAVHWVQVDFDAPSDVRARSPVATPSCSTRARNSPRACSRRAPRAPTTSCCSTRTTRSRTDSRPSRHPIPRPTLRTPRGLAVVE